MNDKIVVKNLYKVFGSHPKRAMEMLGKGLQKDEIFQQTGQAVGVNKADFSIREGEIFVVMGLSGSGKSTLVRLLNRLIEPTAGSIHVGDRDVTAMSRRELTELRRSTMSMVFQSFALLPHRTVLDNASFGLEVAGMPREQRRARGMEALEAVGLQPNAESYPDELSGGMQQRVGLARALANDPEVLLMDEAFSALDPLIRTEMQDELLRLQHAHERTVVFISHDLDEAMRIGDRIAIMQNGQVVQIGTPEEIVSSPANDYVRSFFHGVDVTQVYTAGDVATKKQVTIIRRPGVDVSAALERLREHEALYGVVVDRDMRYQGLVDADALKQAAAGGGEDRWQRALIPGAEALQAGTPLNEVLGLVANAPWPVPVVDADQRYVGSITRARLLQTLNRTG